MFKYIGIIVLAFLLSGCSTIVSQITEITRNDFTRTVELADKYGKPEVKQCFTFLVSALDSLDADQARLDALLAEDTSGLASAALKAVLVKELIQSLNDPVKQAQFEAAFKTNCSAVAGSIMLNLVKDARSVAKRMR